MNRLFRLGTLLCCVLLFCVPAAAAPTYLDTFNGAGETAKDCDDTLAPVLRGRQLEHGDQVQLVVSADQAGRLTGTIRYQAAGAEQVSLRIYTAKGTYVSADSLGQLQLGSDSGVFSPNLSALSQARYNPADGNLYAYREGWQVLAQSPYGNYAEFVPAPGVDTGSLVDYGANLYAVTGGNRKKISLTRTAVKHLEVEGVFYCAEDFTAAIPQGATQIWVEINDPGGVLVSDRGVRTGLAWVAISGKSLLMGSAPAGESSAVPPPPESSQGESSKSASSKQPSSQSPSAPAGGGGGAAAGASSKPQAASSKFEGVITSSSGASGRKSQSAASSSAQSASALADTVPLSEPERTQGPLIYEVKSAPGDSGPDFGMILYILLVSAIILYLLLRPRNRQ